MLGLTLSLHFETCNHTSCVASYVCHATNALCVRVVLFHTLSWLPCRPQAVVVDQNMSEEAVKHYTSTVLAPEEQLLKSDVQVRGQIGMCAAMLYLMLH